MEPIVQMNGITKRFPGVVALDHINFDVKPGEVHVLLGENGAGKSTLMKVLSGAYTPDEGTIVLNGKEYKRLTPHLSAEGGISIIYQELSVVNWLDIRENIFMGRLPCKKVGPAHMVDYATMNKRTEELLAKVNLSHRKPTTNVGDLSISEDVYKRQKLFFVRFDIHKFLRFFDHFSFQHRRQRLIPHKVKSKASAALRHLAQVIGKVMHLADRHFCVYHLRIVLFRVHSQNTAAALGDLDVYKRQHREVSAYAKS